jgi:hypothetical protein
MVNSYPVKPLTFKLGDKNARPVYRKARPQNVDWPSDDVHNATPYQLDAVAHRPRSFTEPRLTGMVPVSFK